MKYGFITAGVIFLSEVVWGTQRVLSRSPEAGGYAAAIAFIANLVGAAYVLHCISTYHFVLTNVEGWSHPISPKKAVRYHFIPLFNLYWNYKWPYEIARFVNWRMQKHRMSSVLAGTIVLFGFLSSFFLGSSLGLIVILSGFAYISRCLRDAFAAQQVPAEMHVTNNLDASALAIKN
ncbi:MAG TPA: hypothetical protein VLK33_02470 [Terriglobales bacterium]|nr:hypothetical protein [Terriglobales bacterium]